MKSIRKQLLTLTALLALILLATPSQAQKYRAAVGWRAGVMTNGVSLKIKAHEGSVVEGILSMYPTGTSLTLLGEKHTPLIFRNLQLYAGMGLHWRFNYQNFEIYDPFFGTYYDVAPPGDYGAGLDAILGIELKFPVLPIAISADIKPMIEISNQGSVIYGWDPGIGLKLTF